MVDRVALVQSGKNYAVIRAASDRNRCDFYFGWLGLAELVKAMRPMYASAVEWVSLVSMEMATARGLSGASPKTLWYSSRTSHRSVSHRSRSAAPDRTITNATALLFRLRSMV